MSEALAKRLFGFSLAFLLAAAMFGYGVATVKYEIWPYSAITGVAQAVRSLKEFGELVPEGRRVRAQDDWSRESFTIHTPEMIEYGYYVFAGWDSENEIHAAWLYDNQGDLRHTWPIDYYALDPDGPSNGGDTPHPFYLLEDGSIIVGWDAGDVMARLDECGEPMWTKDGVFHHSLSRAEDGSFWTWRGDQTAYGHYNYMENFNPDTGQKIQEIALVEDVIARMGSSSAVFGVRPDHPFERMERDPDDMKSFLTRDIFHPNDVDVLYSEFAPLFPMFEAGDLLLSFRTLNLVAVIDPDDRRIKWWSHGPWIGQHDPDFTADGKISVFNNNTGKGRSEIIKMDPMTKEFSNDLFDGEVSFSTAYKGKHQYLPNGNIIIVVPGEGRVLEVTSEGDKVMEFNNLSSVSREYNEHVFNAMRIGLDYFQTAPQCSGSRP